MTENWLELNRANWDDRTTVHAASAFYDLPAFRGDPAHSTLRTFELEELGELVRGRSLLHLQCHMGQDTLSWLLPQADASSVTGLDFSTRAIETARRLAADTGLADRARFVASDVYSAREALAGERFDLVYTGLGALVWLPDLHRWARTVADLLTEDGVLYLAEFHPLTDTLDDDGRTVVQDYAPADSAGELDNFPTTYTDGPSLTHTVNVQWQHPLGEVLTALAAAGLRLEFLHEHDFTLWARYPVLEQSPEDGLYRFPAGHPRIPLMYSLAARRS